MRQELKSFGYILHANKYIFALLIFLCAVTPNKSFADDEIFSDEIIFSNDIALGNFTKTIAKIYTASRSCENTITPGPKEYIMLIATYMVKLYPNGVNYWVIPKKVKMISDPATCVRLIQNKLLDYKNARIDYHKSYPDRNPPPILVAYQWENTYFETVPAAPTRSYIPSEKPAPKAAIKEKFYNNQPGLQ